MSYWENISSKKLILIFFSFSLAVYLPAFIVDFAIHNDYSVWANEEKNFLGFPETNWLVAVGRPINALLLNIQFFFIESIEDFAIARIVSFLTAVLFCLVIKRYLTSRFHLQPSFSAMLAFSILTLPSVQVYTVWATNFVPGSLNILIAVSSYYILERADSKSRKGKAYFLLAFFVFLVSLLVYPPTALTVLLFPFARIIFSEPSEWQKTRKLLTRDLLFTTAGMSVYYVAHKFLILPFLANRYAPIRKQLDVIMAHPKYELSITGDFIEKARQFLKLSGVALSGAWHLAFGSKVALAVLVLLLVGCALVLYRGSKGSGSIGRKAQMLFFVVLLILLANTPMLVAKGSFVTYRFVFVYSAMAVIGLFWLLHRLSLSGLKRFSYAIMVFLVVSSGALTLRNMTQTAINANIELEFVRQKIASFDDPPRLQNISFITVPRGAIFTDSDLRYEFRFGTANFNHVSSIVVAVLDEMGIEDEDIKTTTSYLGNKKTRILKDDDTLIIDMNEARLVGGRYEDEISITRFYASSKGTSPARAFDRTDSSWKATDYPQWIEISYPIDEKITKYAIMSVSPAVIPLNWQLEASNDRTNWVEIDRQTDKIPGAKDAHLIQGVLVPKSWRPLTLDKDLNWVEAKGDEPVYVVEKRVTLKKPNFYKNYRWVFTAGNSRLIEINEILLE
ncbi:MAG: hypothetical protein HY805_04715 [Nitrospirae bacterium]|nr:hypothetical protein [Nitrospirota bacterium]